MSAPAPGSPEWTRLVSASKVAAILGVSPWESPYSLWMTMTGRAPREVRDSDAMQRGNFLENGVIDWWEAKHPEMEPAGRQYAARMENWAIATLDALYHGHEDMTALEVKTTSNTDEWGEPGTDQIPAHYYAQGLWQMACYPPVQRVVFAVLGPFLTLTEYIIERDQAVIDDLIRRCREFYDSLSQDEPPALDDHKATVATLRREHPDIDKGASAAIPLGMAHAWLAAKRDLDAATAVERGTRAAILNAARDAQYVTADGIRIARRQAGKYGVNLYATASPDDLTILESAS